MTMAVHFHKKFHKGRRSKKYAHLHKYYKEDMEVMLTEVNSYRKKNRRIHMMLHKK